MRALPMLLALTLAALLTSCGGAREPSPTPPPAPTVPAVAELIESGAPGPITTIGYLYIDSDGARLADSVSLGESGVASSAAGPAIWVEGAALPADSAITEAGAGRYALVEARGQLEGPGQYGPDGAYTFRLVEPRLEPLSVRELTMPLLLQNSGLYEGQPVRLKGQLLASGESALLVERIGVGGVPADSALQLKLVAPPRDPALAARLRPAGSGDVRFGPVEITGIWRGGRLYPLAVVAL